MSMRVQQCVHFARSLSIMHVCTMYVYKYNLIVYDKGAVAHGVPMEYQFFPIFFFLASLCSFICLQAVYQLSGAVCKATWNGYPSYSLLTFISRFVD